MSQEPLPSTYPRPTFALLRFLQADNLLKDTPVLGRLQQVRDALGYPLIDREHLLSPVEALHELQRQAAAIPGIQLKRQVSPGEENSYHVDLTLSYEQVLNQVQRVSVSATAFLGYLKAVHARILKVSSIFGLWWTDGAEEVMEAVGRAKQKSEKALAIMASDEFSTAMEEKDTEVAAVIEATSLLIGNLKATLKLATDTYQLGRDQINISLTDSAIPNSALPGGAPQTLANRPAPSGSMDSMRQAFGDRVKPAPVKVEEDDLEQALAPGVLTQEAVKEGLHAAEPGLLDGITLDVRVPLQSDLKCYGPGKQMDQELAHASQEGPQEEAPDEPRIDLEVSGNLNLTIPPPTLTLAEKTAEPPASGHKKGDPLPVNFPVSIAACGLTGKHEDVTLRRGVTKLALTAQADPAENGIYRWMGADVPLMRADAPAQVAAPAQVTTARTNPEDPFSEIKVTAPATPVPPSTQATGLLDDDDDEILAHATFIVNATPTGLEPRPDQPTQPQPTPVKVVAQPSPAAVAAPAALFRARTAAPAVAMVTKPFNPSVRPAPAAPGLDDIL